MDDGNYDPNVPDDMQMHQSTAAGDLRIFAEWMHDLRDAYGKDEFVKRLRSGENIPHYKVKSGMVYLFNTGTASTHPVHTCGGK